MEKKHPAHNESSFICPHCGVFAEQIWSHSIKCSTNYVRPQSKLKIPDFILMKTSIAKCSHCNDISIWINQKMVYPVTGGVDIANRDLPVNILDLYNEAKNIVNLSPRGAAAILRLAIQELCIFLGEEGKNINDDIASLVTKGLPPSIQKALDSVRVVGNNAVHPGFIDFKDDPTTAFSLFGFINIIADVLITQPKKIDEYYNKNVPENLRNKIIERDS